MRLFEAEVECRSGRYPEDQGQKEQIMSHCLWSLDKKLEGRYGGTRYELKH